jgi:mannan endo-1,4-beta-mannosidase
MNKLTIIMSILIALLGCNTPVNKPVTMKQDQSFSHFITREGDKLMEGEREFRFLGLAAPNIQMNESQLLPDFSNRFPDEFEIRDILGGLQHIGARATRTFSLSIFSPKYENLPVHVSAHRTYNEDAFKTLDMVIALCHEYDVRLIIPVIASQQFYGFGGVDEFSALAGKPAGSFWTDEDVKDDFRHYLDYIFNRKNTVNGLLYKDDPAVLAWQFGNEFSSYAPDRGMNPDEWSGKILEWSLEMAAYMKQNAPRQLVMEANGASREAFILDPNIDIISEHLYEYWNRQAGLSTDLPAMAREAMEQCRGRKPLIVDEFGLGSIENLRELMQTIREEGIVGGLMWSIRGRRRDGGWYYHNEGGTTINSFHIPGFTAGFDYHETRMLDMLRHEAYLIRSETPPLVKAPAPAPVLLPTEDGFTWRGSAGAAFYIIERSLSDSGPWEILATGLHDSVIADVKSFEPSAEATFPITLYHDESALSDKTYYYRIKGANTGGDSAYSEVLEVKY